MRGLGQSCQSFFVLSISISICTHIYTYIYIYIYLYVSSHRQPSHTEKMLEDKHARMCYEDYADVCMIYIDVCMHVCMMMYVDVCMHVCMYDVCRCMYVCMHV